MTVVEPVLDHAATERARLINKSRAELLRSGRVITLELLARGQEKSGDAARQWARRHRNAHGLVYIVHDDATYLPTFQFDEAFGVDPDALPVMRTLLERGFSDWAVWTWFESASGWLSGRTPAAALAAGDNAGVERALAGLFQE